MSKTDNTKDAEENIQKEINKALDKVKEGDVSALPDSNILMPLVFELLGEEKPNLTDALKNIAILLLGQAVVDQLNKLPNPEEEIKKLVDPLIENLMLLMMTAVSMASLGVVPPPNIAVIKKVYQIIRDFEAASKLIQQQNENQNTNTSSSVSIL